MTGWPNGRLMQNNRLALVAGALVLGLAISGCSKRKDAAVNNNPAADTATQAAAAAAPAGASPEESRAEKDAPYQVRDLQLSVEAYEKIYHRKPASLEQMVQEGFLASLPPPPPGKRYALDSATARVSLVPQ